MKRQSAVADVGEEAGGLVAEEDVVAEVAGTRCRCPGAADDAVVVVGVGARCRLLDRPALQGVVAGTAVDGVVARTALELVVAALAEQRVVAELALDLVVAGDRRGRGRHPTPVFDGVGVGARRPGPAAWAVRPW